MESGRLAEKVMKGGGIGSPRGEHRGGRCRRRKKLGPGGGGWGGEKSLEGGTASSRGKVRGLISVRQVRPSEGNRNLLWQVQLGWKVEGRSEVEPHFPSWMPPDQCAEATDSQWVFSLFQFVEARATGMADGICPVRSMRLEIAVNLAMAASNNSRAPVHPCVCPPCLLLACCFVLYLTSGRGSSRGQMP